MRYFSAILFSVLTISLCWFLDGKRLSSVPLAGGRFLDPFNGFWQNCEEDEEFLSGESLSFSGLKAPVQVVYDDRRVPHIFADHDSDLYFAQGYVTARDRLWQMEFQVKAAAGELSEIINNPRVLNMDRERRRQGMVYAAEKALEKIREDAASIEAIEAYTAGVNAYINSLRPADYPLEFKLLDYVPGEWTVLRTSLLLKMMAWNLTGRTYDFEQSNALSALGWEEYLRVNPAMTDSIAPIIPLEHEWNFSDTLAVPERPLDSLPLATINALQYTAPDPANGSNNWALHGDKTASGYPILCNDPHLGLSLPAIWYEIQLTGPDHSVYGVSLPGAPAVVIGFNQQCAWGVTNASRDVLDWYQINFKDGKRDSYQWGDSWKKTETRIETIKVRNGSTLTDTVIYTHHGPVVYDRNFGDPTGRTPVNLAMKWVAHQPSNELKTFMLLNRAATESDYRQALSHYTCPGQNFVFASRENEVAITQQGKFPNKWKGQGQFVMDGSNPGHAWANYIPWEQNPYVKNPEQGFVFSANQNPVGPTYPYRTDGIYDQTRSRRIYAALKGMEKVTVEDMMDLQNDNYNVLAAEVLPELLAQVPPEQLSAPAREGWDRLSEWTFWNHPELEGPVWFELWRHDLAVAWWKLAHPDLPQLKGLRSTYNALHEIAAQAGDSSETVRQRNAQVLAASLEKSAERLALWQQENPDLAPQWRNYNNARVVHLSRQEAFSHYYLDIGGNKGIVNAMGGNHGPSWRMIVELGPEPKGYGIYPGGPSGNPGSHWYDNQIPDWTQGKYSRLEWMDAPTAGAQGSLQMQPVQQ